MRNIKLIIEYDGTNYAGWQIQKNAKSIQGTLESALKRIIGEKVRLVSCGRTDSGVHAEGHVANFKTNSKISLVNLQRGLNSILPKDIVIKEAKEVPLDFNSRYDAKSKVYRYTILNRSYPQALYRNYFYYVPYKLGLNLMRREAKCLVGKHDFKSFQAADKKKRSSIRTIKKLNIKRKGDLIEIEIEADGFLYNMVRNIVGTLIEIGRGRFKAGSMKKILKAKNRDLAGPTAPAKGLCLVEVKY
ncbi:MAG: tRNA pseudouridine(38-40) synthase TruA [Candidatus Omnitrophota bacterium]